MSGTGAPSRTATPSPTRPTPGPPALRESAFDEAVDDWRGAMTTSNLSPLSMRFWICGAC
jgi:hypothetical protein